MAIDRGEPRWIRWILSVGAMALIGGGAQAGVHVGGWSLTADGHIVPGFNYTGHCPANLRFSWGLIGSAPGPVSYVFNRSDGAQAAGKETALPQANRSVPVYDEWHLGAATPQFKNFKGWVELQVTSPNPVIKRIDFTLHCTG